MKNKQHEAWGNHTCYRTNSKGAHCNKDNQSNMHGPFLSREGEGMGFLFPSAFIVLLLTQFAVANVGMIIFYVLGPV